MLDSLQSGANNYFMEEVSAAVAESHDTGHAKGTQEGFTVGSKEAVEHIFNERGRRRLDKNPSAFLKFPDNYQDYLIKTARKSDAHRAWTKWIFREKFQKKRVLESDPQWIEFQQQASDETDEVPQASDEVPEASDEVAETPDEVAESVQPSDE